MQVKLTWHNYIPSTNSVLEALSFHIFKCAVRHNDSRQSFLSLFFSVHFSSGWTIKNVPILFLHKERTSIQKIFDFYSVHTALKDEIFEWKCFFLPLFYFCWKLFDAIMIFHFSFYFLFQCSHWCVTIGNGTNKTNVREVCASHLFIKKMKFFILQFFNKFTSWPFNWWVHSRLCFLWKKNVEDDDEKISISHLYQIVAFIEFIERYTLSSSNLFKAILHSIKWRGTDWRQKEAKKILNKKICKNPIEKGFFFLLFCSLGWWDDRYISRFVNLVLMFGSIKMIENTAQKNRMRRRLSSKTELTYIRWQISRIWINGWSQSGFFYRK